MRLFLASESKHPDSIVKLKRFAGGLEGKTIAYIPTAANGENPYDDWRKNSGTWKLVQTLGAMITPVPLEEYKNRDVLEVLRGKDILWFAGGASGYLMYWIRRCGIDRDIRNILDSGSIYVGSSAGSMVTSPTLNVSSWYLDYPEPGVETMAGLGIVDFDVYPHYRDELLPEIQKHYQGHSMYLLKNGEAITVTDGKTEVLGEMRRIDSH